MTEVRTITEAEAPQFLDILCSVFELQRGPAEGVFFSEPFYNLDRKWGLFEDGELRSILTTTPLLFSWGNAFGIAGVGTDPRHRRRGLAEHLLEVVMDHGAATGEPAALLFAHQEGVYKRAGFDSIDEVIRADILFPHDYPPVEAVEWDYVKSRYEAWAEADPRRLLRDEARWRYWNWVYRPCEAAGEGYLCVEPLQCREAVGLDGLGTWPVVPGTQWVGLKSLTEHLGVPVSAPRHELILMGRGFRDVPQMFMTDQF